METPIGPEGGVDVRASGAIAQVKWRSAQTGRQEIQALVGARGTDHGIALLFFSASGSSAQAVEYATMMGVALFTFDVRGVLTPASPAARVALHRPSAYSSAQSTSDRGHESRKAFLLHRVLAKRNCVPAASGKLART